MKRLKKVGIMLAMAAGAMLLAVGFNVAEADAAVANVSSDAQMVAALKDANVDEINMTNDIVMTTRSVNITPRRASATLTINGGGHTLTEYWTSGYNASYGIGLRTASNVKQININDMNIVGQNGYGTIYVGCNKGVTLNYTGVNYVGPQITYNDCGTARYENTNITIQKHTNGSYAGEVAEAMNVVLAGNVNITKMGGVHTSGDEIFYIKNCGTIRTEADANVNIDNKSSNTLGKDHTGALDYYSHSGFVKGTVTSFDMGARSVFDYDGISLFEDCATFKNVNIGEDAQFLVDITMAKCTLMTVKGAFNVGQRAKVHLNIVSTYCPTKALYLACCAPLTVNEDADFIVTSNGVPYACGLVYATGNVTVKEGVQFDVISMYNLKKYDSKAMYMAGCKNTLDIQNPERFLAYNNNDLMACKTMGLQLACGITIKVNGYNVEYWEQGAARSGGPTVLENSDYKWSTDDWSTFNIHASGLYCNKYFKQFWTDFNGTIGGNYRKGLDKYTFAPKKNSNIFLVNGKPEPRR